MSTGLQGWLDRRRAADVRVRAGAAFLDEWTPGWRDRVDAARLNVGDVRGCPLAQATGLTFRYACAFYGLTRADATRYGFNVARRANPYDYLGSEVRREFGELTDAWQRYLAGPRSRPRALPTPRVPRGALPRFARTS